MMRGQRKPGRPFIRKSATRMPAAKARSSKRKTRIGGLAATARLRWLFPKLTSAKKRFGMGVVLATAKREGQATSVHYAVVEEAFEKPGRRPKAALLAKADARSVATMLCGLAHPDRVRVASAIMTGSNTHRLLKASVGLKTGPLYHHVRGLQMAGLVTLAARNLYTLTELGEAVLLTATGLGMQAEGKRSTWKRHLIRSP